MWTMVTGCGWSIMVTRGWTERESRGLYCRTWGGAPVGGRGPDARAACGRELRSIPYARGGSCGETCDVRDPVPWAAPAAVGAQPVRAALGLQAPVTRPSPAGPGEEPHRARVRELGAARALLLPVPRSRGLRRPGGPDPVRRPRAAGRRSGRGAPAGAVRRAGPVPGGRALPRRAGRRVPLLLRQPRLRLGRRPHAARHAAPRPAPPGRRGRVGLLVGHAPRHHRALARPWRRADLRRALRRAAAEPAAPR